MAPTLNVSPDADNVSPVLLNKPCAPYQVERLLAHSHPHNAATCTRKDSPGCRPRAEGNPVAALGLRRPLISAAFFPSYSAPIRRLSSFLIHSFPPRATSHSFRTAHPRLNTLTASTISPFCFSIPLSTMVDISSLKLDAVSQTELEQFFETEQAQSRVQSQIHNLTSLCWDKCVGSISSSFSGKEQNCLANCVDRFFDTSNHLVGLVEQQRAKAGAS